jgi:hypothetical protein
MGAGVLLPRVRKSTTIAMSRTTIAPSRMSAVRLGAAGVPVLSDMVVLPDACLNGALERPHSIRPVRRMYNVRGTISE